MRLKIFVFAMIILLIGAFAGRQRRDGNDEHVINERGTRDPSGPRPEPLTEREAKSLKRKIEPLEELRDQEG